MFQRQSSSKNLPFLQFHFLNTFLITFYIVTRNWYNLWRNLVVLHFTRSVIQAWQRHQRSLFSGLILFQKRILIMTGVSWRNRVSIHIKQLRKVHHSFGSSQLNHSINIESISGQEMIGSILEKVLNRHFHIEFSEIGFEMTCSPLLSHWSVLCWIHFLPIYLETLET